MNALQLEKVSKVAFICKLDWIECLDCITALQPHSHFKTHKVTTKYNVILPCFIKSWN